MSPRSRRTLIVILLLLLAGLVLLFAKCARPKAIAHALENRHEQRPIAAVESQHAVASAQEILTPATLQVPTPVDAGAPIRVTWTGPNNLGDYLTIVRPDAKAE